MKSELLPATKFCNKCGNTYPIENFAWRKDRNGPHSNCKVCRNAYSREWQRAQDHAKRYAEVLARDPEYHRKRKLKNLYGITMEEYWAMHERQGGLCAICGEPETRKLKGEVAPLVVDHCHGNGKVRGLLCHTCNTGLGIVERREWLKQAMLYLDETQAPEHNPLRRSLCVIEGCSELTTAEHLMCRPHWDLVPGPLKSGWQKARTTAINFLRSLEKENKR